MNKEGKVGIYIRLSLADEDTGNSKTESDSIGNQRMLINRFLDSVNANQKMSIFAEKECHFSPDSIQVYTALTTTLLDGRKRQV